ncbi:MAG: tetratricopeptide repeat-containing sensor histidine kinase [Candidatus Delongbacteria bacterium]|nr:tetratricopeptide repeat-containing sensor histidine kinase [Candidatus Delongbacteria bacterium]
MKQILLTSILLFFIFSVTAAEKDSLKNLISSTKGDQKIELMIELAEVIYTEKLDDALSLLEEAEKLATESGKIKLNAKAHYKAGKFLFRNDKYFESIDEYKPSLKIYEELIDKRMIIELTLNMGQSYYHLSDFNTALIFFYKSLKYADNISDDFSRAEAFNNIGSVFDETKDYEKALENFNKALDIYRSSLKVQKIAEVLNNIAIVYTHQGRRDEALKSLKKVLKIYKNEDIELYQAIIMNNMSDILIEQEKFKEALQYLGKASKIFKKLGDNYGLALVSHNYGKAYLDSKNHVLARKYLLKSKIDFEEMGVQVMVRNNLINLVELDSTIGNYKQAFFNLKKYNKINGEILSSEKEQKIAELEKKYKIKEKEKQLFSQIRDNKLTQANLDKQKSINQFFLIVFLLSVLVIFFIYRSYKHKSAKQELLKKYSSEIEVLNKKLNEEIKITTDKLNESNEKLVNSAKGAARLDKMVSLGTLLAGITHEIKNPGQVIKLSLDNMKLSLNDLALFIYDLIKVKSSDRKGALETKKLVKKHEINKIFNDLKSLVISNKKSIGIIEQIVDSTAKMSYYSRKYTSNSLNDIVKDVLVLVKNNIKYHAKIKLHLHPKLPMYKCNFQEIAQILFNVLSNAKDAILEKGFHSDQGIINISTKYEDKNIILAIRDNGCGMDELQLDQAFNSFYTTKEMGKGLGLGLSIVKGIVDDYKGKITIQSKVNEGTEFKIYFPTTEDASIERDNNTFNTVEFIKDSETKSEYDLEIPYEEKVEIEEKEENGSFILKKDEYPDDDFFNDDKMYLKDNDEEKDA